MNCPKCNTENNDGAFFCKECGAKLEAPANDNVIIPQIDDVVPEADTTVATQADAPIVPQADTTVATQEAATVATQANTTVTEATASTVPSNVQTSNQSNTQSQTSGSFNNNYNTPVYTATVDNTPISMWGYFGYEILFSIPCIGFIFLCIYAFGGTKNVNLKNFARSYFCYLIIVAIILVLLFVLGIFGTATGAIN